MEAEPIPHAAAKGAPARRGSGDDNEKSGADGAESDSGGHARRNEEEHGYRLPKGQSQQMASLRAADRPPRHATPLTGASKAHALPSTTEHINALSEPYARRTRAPFAAPAPLDN